MRLQLTRRGDYGVRAMLELGRHPDETLSSSAIARSADIPRRFVNQVMGDLVRAGLVKSHIGRTGGYRLARQASEISVLSIVEAIETDTRRLTCVLRATACSRQGACEVHEIFMAAQEMFLGELSRASLVDALEA